MGKEFLIDSNIAIGYIGGTLTHGGLKKVRDVVNDSCQISVVTKIEILGFNSSTDEADLLERFVNDSTVYLVNDEVADKAIEIKKSKKIKTPDAIIAATALVNSLTLLTRNVSDFKGIKGLDVLNPYEL